MFSVESDKTINITRGDSIEFVAPVDYSFQAGDVLRLKVFRKKACEDVVLQKDFTIEEATETVNIALTEQDTRIGEVISKPVDYWYELEVNPENNPQTILGYDDDGAKIFRLYPAGRDIEDDELTKDEAEVLRKTLTEFKENEIPSITQEYVDENVIPIVSDPKIWKLESGIYRVSGLVKADRLYEGFMVYDNSPLIITKDGDTTIFYLYLGGYGEMPYDIVTGTTDGSTCEWFGIASDRNKAYEINNGSTDDQYPTAKAVYDLFSGIEIPENYESFENKVTEINEKSTDNEYPSAKAVYDLNSNLFEQGKNLFNGIYEVGRANGDDSKTSESRSQWIAVEEGETYTFSHSKSASNFQIYGKTSTESQVYIHSGNIEKSHTFAIPDGITHIRFSAYNTVLNSNNIQFEMGSEATEYEPYRFVIKKDLLPTDNAAEIPEDIQEQIDNKQDKLVSGQNIKTINGKSLLGSGNITIEPVTNSDGSTVIENSAFEILPTGKNLFNRETDTVGKKITSTGELTTNANYETTDFISVIGGEKYYCSVSIDAITYFDVNKNAVGYKAYPSRPTIFDENVKYIRFSFAKSSTNVQFEQSAKATEYEAFVGADMLDGNKVNFVDKSLKPEKTGFFELKANGKNLLNRDVSLVGYSIGSSGAISTSANSETSDFIPVTYGDIVSLSGLLVSGITYVFGAIGEYDENFNLVSYFDILAKYPTNTSITVNINRNVHYIRVVYRKAATNVQIEFGAEPTEYEAFVGVQALKKEYMNFRPSRDFALYSNPWFGKKLVVDGDSITHDQGGYNYWQYVARDTLEMVLPPLSTTPASGRNGIAGSRIANELGANDPNQSIVVRYMNLPDDADIVMIAGGTNDWAHDKVPMGEFDSTDDTTFNGALNILLQGLKTKYPTIPVVMMTPIKRGTIYNKKNDYGLTQEDYVDAMIKKCRQYGVYCLDMYANCPINPQIPVMKELLFKENDDTHPNTEGHKVMGRTVAGFIRTLS